MAPSTCTVREHSCQSARTTTLMPPAPYQSIPQRGGKDGAEQGEPVKGSGLADFGHGGFLLGPVGPARLSVQVRDQLPRAPRMEPLPFVPRRIRARIRQTKPSELASATTQMFEIQEARRRHPIESEGCATPRLPTITVAFLARVTAV